MMARRIHLAVLLAGMAAVIALTGCSKPELTNEQALALIQAHYDQAQPVVLTFKIDQRALADGNKAKYWGVSKHYPNNLWADFTLTEEGKKLVRLPNGKDVFEWRQDSTGKFQYAMTTAAPLKLKARDVSEIRKEIVPGVKGQGRVVVFKQAYDISSLPSELQNVILDNTSNQLSIKRLADMAFENGAWVFHDLEQ